MTWKSPKTSTYFYDKMKVLVAGCETHKSYRGIAKPRGTCRTCKRIFKLACELEADGYLERKSRK